MSDPTPALPDPGARSLQNFPRWLLSARRTLRRGHRVENNPWWFSSSGTGRFDLPAPKGTCHLALDVATAVRETAGERLVALGIVDDEFARGRCVSSLHVPTDHVLAATCTPAAAIFGVTRELSTLTPYTLPQRWARSLHEARFAGIYYQTRFTTTPKPNAVAVFGPTGERSWPGDEHPLAFAAAAQQCGLRVGTRPRTVNFHTPPRHPPA